MVSILASDQNILHLNPNAPCELKWYKNREGKRLIFLFSFSLLTSFFSCRIPNSKCMFCSELQKMCLQQLFFRFCVALIACLFLESKQNSSSNSPIGMFGRCSLCLFIKHLQLLLHQLFTVVRLASKT